MFVNASYTVWEKKTIKYYPYLKTSSKYYEHEYPKENILEELNNYEEQRSL